MKLRLVFLFLGILMLLGTGSAWAHDETIDLIEMSLGDVEIREHQDEAPYKGTVFLTIENSGIESWGDFHFSLDPDKSVVFSEDNGYPSMSGVSSFRSEIVNDGYDLNFYFYGDPVTADEVIFFSVYTDNTADELEFFSMSLEATPVPIPGAALLLGSGLIGLFGLRRKN